MLEINEAKQIALQELIEKYKNGNKKALSDIFSLLKNDIFSLLEQGVSIRLTKKIVEKATELQIKDDTFYKWVQRNRTEDIPLKRTELASNAKKEIKQGLTPLKGKKSLTGQNKAQNEQKGSIEPAKKDVVEIMNSTIGTDLYRKYLKK